jgi:hypothetical protein
MLWTHKAGLTPFAPHPSNSFVVWFPLVYRWWTMLLAWGGCLDGSTPPPPSLSLSLSPSPTPPPPTPHQEQTRDASLPRSGLHLFWIKALLFFYPFLYQCCFSFSVPVSVYKNHNTDFSRVSICFCLPHPFSVLELGFFVLFLRTWLLLLVPALAT